MRLNQRELEVLKILHSSDQAMTSTQIVHSGDGLTQSTVQAVIRKLMAADLIEVQGITHSGNVLSRTFSATEKSKEVLNQRFLDFFRDHKGIVGLRAAILDMFEMEEDEAKKAEDIRELEKLLKELKAKY